MTTAAPRRAVRREDRAWSPYRRAKGQLKAIVDEAISSAIDLETIQAVRNRKRCPADKQRFQLAIEALIADLAHRFMTDGCNSRICLSLDNNDLGGVRRYRPKAVGLCVKQALDLLSSRKVGSWIAVSRSKAQGERTTIRPGRQLREALAGGWLDSSCFCDDFSGEEVLLLRSAPIRRYARQHSDDFDASRAVARLVDYPDTAKTAEERNAMLSINTKLRAMDVEVLSEDGRSWTKADMRSVHLRRIFTRGDTALDKGGRLFDATNSAVWYNMKNKEVELKRAQRLRIAGEPVATVDMHAAGLTTLYAMAGVRLPDHDLYQPPGVGLEHRDTLKLAAQCAIFGDHSQRTSDKPVRYRWPTRSKEDDKPTMNAAEAYAILHETHAPVRSMFWRGIGHHVQRIESDVLVHALTINPDLMALPLHDALIVPIGQAELASHAFAGAFEAVTGGHCRMKIE